VRKKTEVCERKKEAQICRIGIKEGGGTERCQHQRKNHAATRKNHQTKGCSKKIGKQGENHFLKKEDNTPLKGGQGPFPSGSPE